MSARSLVLVIAIITGIVSLTSPVCNADEGDLDLTFGVGGLVTTGFQGSNHDQGHDVVAVQWDGRIVAVGSSLGLSGRDYAVARYNTDGSLDSTFGDGGMVLTDLGSNNEFATAVVVQTDDKIVVAGYSNQGFPTWFDFVVVRYNADGTLDNTFGSGGVVITDTGNSVELANGMELQSDGKILVAGQAGNDFGLIRYNADGSLDSSFGSGGVVITNIGPSLDTALNLAIQSDGKIIAVGYSNQFGSYYDFAISRYNTDGSLDSTFGSGGVVTTHFGYTNDYAYGVAIQSDGNIVVGGNSLQPGTGSNYALARYDVNGSLDLSFGSGGLVTTQVSYADNASDVAVKSDGQIILTGYSNMGSPNGNDFTVLAYNTNGSLDTGFGVGGVTSIDIGSTFDLAYGSSVQADGKIVSAGVTRSNFLSQGEDFALTRVNADGSLDSSFGSGGLVITDFQGQNNETSLNKVLALQADGKIVVVGSTKDFIDQDIALARYNPDGSLDATFGTDGQVVTDYGADWGEAVAITGTGKIIVAGSTIVGTSYTGKDFIVLCYNSDGSIDTTFGSSGVVSIDFGGLQDEATSVVIQTDGKILVAGRAFMGYLNAYDFALARLNSNGTLDTTFDTDGKVTADFASSNELASAMSLQSDGKIVIAGDSAVDNWTPGDFVVARFNTDGSIDTSFGSGGRVTTDIAGSYDVASGVAIQADGRIVAAGFAYMGYPNLYDIAVVRYNSDGSLDTTFDLDGIVTTHLGYGDDNGYDVALQDDGRIVVVGSKEEGATFYDFALVRYNIDGSLDTNFGTSGTALTDFAGGSDVAYAVVIQADGNIVIAGESYSGPETGTDFALARYIGLSSPDALIEIMVADIQDNLVPNPLNNGQGNSLLVKLQGALQKLDAGKTDTAINKLQAFINAVNGFVDGGILTPEEGLALTDMAELIIATI